MRIMAIPLASSCWRQPTSISILFCFMVCLRGGRIEALYSVPFIRLSALRTWPVITFIDWMPLAQDLLIILILLSLLRVFLDGVLALVSRGGRCVRITWPIAFLEVIHRTASLLLTMAMLIVLVVVGITVEMALLLQIAGGVRARLDVASDVSRLRPLIILTAEVLSRALLIIGLLLLLALVVLSWS